MRYKKLVLVNPPVWDARAPPINISYLAAFAKQKGYSVKSFDFNIELFHIARPSIRKFWKADYMDYWNNDGLWHNELKPLLGKSPINLMLAKIMNENPDVVGFTINYSCPLIIDLARSLKQSNPKIVIVVGGNSSERFMCGERFVMSGCIDFSVLGEGELTLIDIMHRLNKGLNLDDIPGTLVMRNGSIVENQRRRRIIDVDSIPFPDFSDFDLSLYRENDSETPAVRLPLLFSRGCVFNCDFCLQNYIWGKPFRMRTPENLVEEIERDIQEFNVNGFQFSDLEINGDLRRLESFCDIIIKKKLKIGWGAGAVIRKDMGLGLLRKLKKAGCQWLDHGLESGSAKVIKAMGKHFTPDEVREHFQKLKEIGISSTVSLIVGHPEESKEDFHETLNLLKYIMPYLDQTPSVSVCIVFPRTPLCRKMEQYGAKPNETQWAYWKIPGNDFSERKRRVKMLNEFFKSHFEGKEIKIPNDALHHYK